MKRTTCFAEEQLMDELKEIVRGIHAAPMNAFIPIDIIDLIYVFDDPTLCPRKILQRGSAVFGRQISRSTYARSEEDANISRSADHDPLDTPGTRVDETVLNSATSGSSQPAPAISVEALRSYGWY